MRPHVVFTKPKIKKYKGMFGDTYELEKACDTISQLEIYVNRLIEIMNARDAGEFSAVVRDEVIRDVADINYLYASEKTDCLTEEDRHVFYQSIADYGIVRCEPGESASVLEVLLGEQPASGYVAAGVRVMRELSLDEQFGEWSVIRLYVEGFDRSKFYSFGDGTDTDPLALISSAGLTMHIWRNEESTRSTDDSGRVVMLRGVTTQLHCNFLRATERKGVLATDFDADIQLTQVGSGLEKIRVKLI